MKPLFKHCVFLDSRKYVKDYIKKDKSGNLHSAVSIDSDYEDYYAYPYDLAWKLPMNDFAEVPEVKYITDGGINSKITLREDQEPYVQLLKNKPRGTFISKPGTGKTVMALELINRNRFTTLILVSTKDLLFQWVRECEELLNYKPGIIGDGKYRIKDITIATFQTLAKTSEKLLNIKDKFTQVIVDECHHVPAMTFKYVLSNIEALFKLGLTGTYKRKDGLQFITNWMLSDVVLKNVTDNTMKPEIVIVRTGIKIPKGDSFIECLSNLQNEEKLPQIVSKMINKNPNRYQLVLVRRLCTIEQLAERNKNAIVITGSEGDRSDLNKRILENKIIISTILDEGTNIPNLDTLHLVHPSNNLPQLEQKIARINRPVPGKRTPLVFDYWYKHQKGAIGFNVNNQQETRLKFYRQQGYRIHEV